MNALLTSLRRGWHMLGTRRLYLTMVLVPLGCCLFFVSLMKEGLPLPVPVAVVDMDGTSMSRQVVRQLQANQFVEIVSTPDTYAEAMDAVDRGDIFGFFYIPRNFQKDAVGGGKPALSLYCNMAIFVPGTMSFKGFKTVGVSTKGKLVVMSIVSAGVGESTAETLVQPVVVQNHLLNNPWLSYAIYLNNSFIPGVLALMVMLMTAWCICIEFKEGTSPQWLADARGSMLVALIGKLAPQTLVFSAVGFAIQAWFYGYLHYPMHNHWFHIVGAMVLMVIACQAFAVIVCAILPNLRLALTICALLGILSFSVTGFSFPVPQMYPSVGIFAYIIPLRWYFLIYVDQALNGIPIYYSRMYYICLLLFPLVSLLGLPRLRRRCLNPVYIP